MGRHASVDCGLRIVDFGLNTRNPPEAVASDKWLKAVYALIEEVLDEAQGSPGFTQDVRLALRSSRAGATGPSFVLLPCLCCQAVGGEQRHAIVVAAAWQLLVLAARILDDLEDQDVEGDLGTVLGPARAINVATGLMAAAPLALTHLQADAAVVLDLLQDFQCATLRICAGQHQDLAPGEIGLEAYEEIVAAKTGETFALACRAGARVGGGDAQQIALLSEFGHHLGMLNQIGDDVSGLWSKADHSDLVAGRKTWPVLYALSVASASERERLQGLLERARGDAEAEARARQKITDLGALHYLLLQAEVRHQRAKVALKSVGAPWPIRQQLSALLEQSHGWKDQDREASCAFPGAV